MNSLDAALQFALASQLQVSPSLQYFFICAMACAIAPVAHAHPFHSCRCLHHPSCDLHSTACLQSVPSGAASSSFACCLLQSGRGGGSRRALLSIHCDSVLQLRLLPCLQGVVAEASSVLGRLHETVETFHRQVRRAVSTLSRLWPLPQLHGMSWAATRRCGRWVFCRACSRTPGRTPIATQLPQTEPPCPTPLPES